MDIRARAGMPLWKILMLLVVFSAVTGCKIKTQGLADLRDANGESYSFVGATVSLFPLNASAVMPTRSATPLATATVTADTDTITLAAPLLSFRSNRFYLVEFRCPNDPPVAECEVATPLHIVLTGAQLRAGQWRATVLSEAAYNAVTYGAVAGFNASEIQQVLDHAADILLAGSYQDLQAWNPDDSAALQRPAPLAPISEALAEGIAHNDLKIALQQWLSLTQVGSLQMASASFTDLIIDDSYLYRARATGLDVVDIRDPQRPVQVGQADFSSGRFPQFQQALLQDGFVYMTTQGESLGPSTLWVVDVRDPLNPVLARQQTLAADAQFMVSTGDYLLLGLSRSAPWYRNMIVVDIHNPQQPVVVVDLPLTDSANGAALSGQHLFISDNKGLTIVDVSNPLAPIIAGQWQELRFFGAMAAANDRLYMAVAGPGLMIIDVSQPLEPVISAQLTFDRYSPYRTISTIHPMGDEVYLFLGSDIQKVDVRDPAAPRSVGTLSPADTFARTLAVGQDHLYVGSHNHLDILSLAAMEYAPALLGSLDVPGGVAASTAVTPRMAYAPVHERGVQMIDLRRPRAPALLDLDPRFDQVFDIAFSGPVAYFGDRQHFRVLDISNPARLVELPGTIPLQERGYDTADSMIVADNYAYLSTVPQGEFPENRLVVMDLQDARMPVLVSHIALPPFAMIRAVTGDKAYVDTATDEPGITLVDIQNPRLPRLTGSDVTLPVWPRDAVATDDFLYLASGDVGLLVIDARDPEQLTIVNQIATAGTATSITLQDDYLLVADSAAGIVLLDLVDPAAPQIVGHASVRGHARAAFVQNGLLYAATSTGLDILKTPK